MGVPVNLDWTRDPPPSQLTPYQQHIREIDWSQTRLGPIRSWPRELRQMVLFMMAEVNPVILYWGDHSTIIYNEAYVPLVGKKHPQLQGMDASDAFPDFWDYFHSIISEQRSTGQTCVGEASMLLMERHGFLEETYFDWKLIPVVGDDGTVLGSYGRPTESSGEVINSRRVACIQTLTQHTINPTSFDDLWTLTAESLASNERDLPAVMLYSLNHNETVAATSEQAMPQCKLEFSLRIPSHHPYSQVQLDLQSNTQKLAPVMREALLKQSIYVYDLLETDLEHDLDHLAQHTTGVPVQNLALLPIIADGIVAAVLVIGLNPRVKFPGQYHDFIQMLGDVLSVQISKLKLAERLTSQDRLVISEFHKKEMKFSRFAGRSPLGLTVMNREGVVAYANDAWYKFCGIDTADPEPSQWIDTVYGDDLPVINEWWHKVINLKQSGTFQVRSQEPFINGTMTMPYKTGLVSIYPDLDDEGNVSTVMGLVTDISELKWTEEQLRLRQKELELSEKKSREFAEQAPIGVVRTDSTGFVLFANDTWRSFYNFDRDHIFEEPQPWLKSLNKEDAPIARQFFEDIRSTGHSSKVEVRLTRRKSATEAGRATPAEFWILASGFAELNLDGSVKDITFWVTDISDQKAAERILTDKMEEAIRLKNTQEKFVDMISHEIRNPLSAILHCGEEIVDAMRKCLVSAKTTSPVDTGAEQIVPNAQSTRHINNALDAANTIMYCVQHQKQIVDDVLTLSKLDADLLVVSPIPVQPRELVTSALKIFEPELKAAEIELAFKIDSSLERLNVDWVMLDPNRFLQIVINLVTNAIKFTRNSTVKRIVISVAARGDKPSHEYGGLQYVPRREIERNAENSTIENGLDQTSPSNDLYLCFSIADTGKGLTEAERTTLFNRFAQASPKTHIEYGGSGLGLFISRQITEMLGGEIGVGSEPGKGATFAFYVHTRHAKPPRRASLGVEATSVYTKTLMTPTPGTWVAGSNGSPLDSDANQRDKARPTLPTPEPVTHKRRVLVVEDNIVNQKVLCKQLRNRGFLVEAANHGREALDALHKVVRDADPQGLKFDVILCDIEMPVMDGIECVTEIRRLEAEQTFRGHMPIIGVTANVRSKQVNTAIEVGMDGVTTKPYRIDELIAHIDRVSADVKMSKSTAA